MDIIKAKNDKPTNNGASIIKISNNFQILDTSKDVEPDFNTLQNLNNLNFDDPNYYWLAGSGVPTIPATPTTPTPTTTITPTPSVTSSVTPTTTITPSITQTTTPSVTPTITPSQAINPLFIASAYNSSSNANTIDGSSWSYSNFSNSRLWTGLTYGSSGYLAVAYNSNNYDTSSDGINWTNNTYDISHPNNLFTKTIHGNGKYLIFANNATGFYSINLTNWNTFTLPAGNWNLAAYGNNTYIAAITNSSTIATSNDAITWTQRSLPVSKDWQDMIYAGGYFVLIAQNTNTVLYSSDGINWNIETLVSANLWKAISYGNNIYVILADGSSRINYSNDLVNWTESLGLGFTCTDLTFGNNTFIGVGIGSIALTSSNGTTWTQRSINSNNWNNIVFNN